MQAHAPSAHADRNELVRWLSGFSRPTRHTFIVHGEPSGSSALQEHIRRYFEWEVTTPKMGEIYEIA